MTDPVLRSWLAGCTAAHRRLETLLATLTGDVLRRPSVLPGWTVGHVLTHIARNADSQIRMLEGARHGRIADQYPGGAERREAEIEAGHRRPHEELLADVTATNALLERAWSQTPDEVWETGLGRMVSGAAETVAELVFRRWREAEVHAADLGVADLGGPGWDDLTPSYVDVEWERAMAGLPARLDPGPVLVVVPGDRPSRAFGVGPRQIVVRATPGRILGWLMGRTDEPGWPALRPWT